MLEKCKLWEKQCGARETCKILLGCLWLKIELQKGALEIEELGSCFELSFWVYFLMQDSTKHVVCS